MKYLILLTLLVSPAFAKGPCITIDNVPLKNNRIAIVGGAAPRGLNLQMNGPNTASVKVEYFPVLGVSYERRLDDTDTFVGIEMLSNGTYLIRAGEEF